MEGRKAHGRRREGGVEGGREEGKEGAPWAVPLACVLVPCSGFPMSPPRSSGRPSRSA